MKREIRSVYEKNIGQPIAIATGMTPALKATRVIS